MPTLFRHHIPHLQNIHLRVLRSESDDRSWRGTENVEFGDTGGNSIGDTSCTCHNITAGVKIASGEISAESEALLLYLQKTCMCLLVTHVLHSSPRSSNKSARTTRDGERKKELLQCTHDKYNKDVKQLGAYREPDKLGLA